MNYKKILEARGFPLSFRNFGRIVGFSSHHLRRLYFTEQKRFYQLLDSAIEKWNSIVHPKSRK